MSDNDDDDIVYIPQPRRKRPSWRPVEFDDNAIFGMNQEGFIGLEVMTDGGDLEIIQGQTKVGSKEECGKGTTTTTKKNKNKNKNKNTEADKAAAQSEVKKSKDTPLSTTQKAISADAKSAAEPPQPHSTKGLKEGKASSIKSEAPGPAAPTTVTSLSVKAKGGRLASATPGVTVSPSTTTTTTTTTKKTTAPSTSSTTTTTTTRAEGGGGGGSSQLPKGSTPTQTSSSSKPTSSATTHLPSSSATASVPPEGTDPLPKLSVRARKRAARAAKAAALGIVIPTPPPRTPTGQRLTDDGTPALSRRARKRAARAAREAAQTAAQGDVDQSSTETRKRKRHELDDETSGDAQEEDEEEGNDHESGGKVEGGGASIKANARTPNEQTKEKDNKKAKKQKVQKPQKGAGSAGEADKSVPEGEETFATSAARADARTAAAAISTTDVTAWRTYLLDEALLNGLRLLGFEHPTPIQSQTLGPALIQRNDIVGAAETGSGKTLAFGLPILHQLLALEAAAAAKAAFSSSTDPTDSFVTQRLPCLIITPTRELAVQITNHLKAAAQCTTLRIVSIVGGMSVEKQERQILTRPHIVVGTPGRLWQLMTSNHKYLSDLSGLRFLVIDEADRIVGDGAFEELDNILGLMPDSKQKLKVSYDADYAGEGMNVPEHARAVKRQTFVFSATLLMEAQGRVKVGSKARKLGKASTLLDTMLTKLQLQNKMELVDITSAKVTAENLEERKITCVDTEKDVYLYYLFCLRPGKILVFVNAITAIKRLLPILALLRVEAFCIHAEMQQRQRLKNLDRFKAARECILIATDVAARGLDIPTVDIVVHYQMPRTSDTYVHRAGRTARAQNPGLSVAFVDPTSTKTYEKICKVLGKENGVPELDIDNGYLPGVRDRMQSARILEKLIHQNGKVVKQNNWYARQAAELDIDVDDDLLEKEDPRTKARNENQIAQKKAALAELLQRPLLPQGGSMNFFSNHMRVGEILNRAGKNSAIKSK